MSSLNIQTPSARNSDPITSHIAGDEITKSGKRQKQIEDVTGFVRKTEGLTSLELAKEHGYCRFKLARRLPEASQLKKGESRKCKIGGRSAVTWWVK